MQSLWANIVVAQMCLHWKGGRWNSWDDDLVADPREQREAILIDECKENDAAARIRPLETVDYR